MDPEIAAHFAGITDQARGFFEQVEYTPDATPERAILRLQVVHGRYRIFITELFSEGLRKYRYYILQNDRVEAGFDNAPDPRALRLRYGRISAEHVGELVPHLHEDDKTKISLTEEITFSNFIDWLKEHF